MFVDRALSTSQFKFISFGKHDQSGHGDINFKELGTGIQQENKITLLERQFENGL